MNVRTLSVIVGGSLCFCFRGRARPGGRPTMTVFVTAAAVTDVEKIDKATETRLLDAIKAARQKRKDLEKALKAQHGKKREAWPAESRINYDAEEVEALAEADWAYRKVKQEGLTTRPRTSGSRSSATAWPARGPHHARQLGGRRAGDRRGERPPIGKQRRAARADGLARRPLLDQLRRQAGAEAARRALRGRAADLPPPPRRLPGVASRHPAARPAQWRFEAHGFQRWGNAANVASVLVEDFIGKNYDAMQSPVAAK